MKSTRSHSVRCLPSSEQTTKHRRIKTLSNLIEMHRATAAVLLVISPVAVLISGVISEAIGQEQVGSQAQKKPDRWDRQPQLTNAVVLAEERVYKSTPQGDLKLHIWSPKAEGKDRPCIVFFFGGGWTSGDYRQFARQSAYLASRGMVAASAEYRIRKLHNTTPDVCVEDAKSAIRWVRAHAKELGIDPSKVIAAGGSAGGHLAAATALVPGFDAVGDDLSISAIPNAMVLYNPGTNPSLSGRNVVRSREGKDITKAISPTLFIHEKTPPALLFYGSEDAALAQGVEYAAKARELGLDVELWLASDQPHGFFNDNPWLEVTTLRLVQYLTRLGYLSGQPTVSLPENTPSLTLDKGTTP
jgi:acetyl esterase